MKRLIVAVLLSVFPLRLSQEALPFFDTTLKVQEQVDHFDLVYCVIRLHEGNYVNHPLDKGKETYAGIARKSNPFWPGWEIVDSLKRKTGPISRFTYVEQVEKAVREYYLNIWLTEGFNKITNPNVAYYVFDIRIHHRSFIRLIDSVIEDHKIEYREGWAAQLDTLSYDGLVERLRDRRLGLFYYLVKQDPSQQVFLKGWMKRARVTEIV